MGCKVRVRPGEPIARALRKLKRMLDESGMRHDQLRHAYATTRGQRRRLQRRLSAKRVAKAASD